MFHQMRKIATSWSEHYWRISLVCGLPECYGSAPVDNGSGAWQGPRWEGVLVALRRGSLKKFKSGSKEEWKLGL